MYDLAVKVMWANYTCRRSLAFALARPYIFLCVFYIATLTVFEPAWMM